LLTGPTNEFELKVDAGQTAGRRRASLRSAALPVVVLIVSLAATGVVWYGLKAQAEANAAAEFEEDTRQISATIGARMRAYKDALQSVVALFAASDTVTRDDWRRFVDGLELRRDYPGIEMLGLAKHLRMQQLAGHERDMRAQGFLEYRVWPAGNRDEYMAVTFIEPFDGQTRGVLGYDMLANPTSRSAMEQASATGAASLSGRWTVVQNTRSDSQATILMFAPLYSRESSPADIVHENAPVDYVYAALRCDDLMADILRNSVIDIGLAVYDGNRAPAGSLLYADARARDVLGGRSKPTFTKTVPMTISGHDWTLQFFSEPYLKAVPQRQMPLIALAAGIPLSLLLFGIAWSQATLRERAVKIAEDMTASLRAQAGLLDLTHDTVFLRDRNNIIRYWNRAASDTYGFSAEEAIGRIADELLHTRFPLPLQQIWHELRNTGRWEGELIHTRRGGTEIIVASRWAVHRDAHGEIEAILETNNDVTEQRRAEEERRRLEASLLQASKLEAMGTLAGGVAHDFNNILGAILGYGELAQSDAPTGSAMRRYVDNIMSAGQRARSLVARILAFSRSGLGQRLPVHAQSVVAETLDLLSASLPDDVRLERSLAADDAAVIGDPTQIHQVVLNLCTNAVQAMKSGGTLSVRLEVITLQAPMTLVTGALAAGEYVRLEVSDTGGGIDADLRDRIFDPFFTTKGVGVGTGLGLSLVHGIATDLGGGVDMRSEVDRGTTFSVYLPCCGRTAQVAGEPEALPRGNGEIVMLVDDEEVLVRLGEEMIAELGYEPVGFTSPADALEAFRTDPQRFSVVLSDETMPGMTGSQLAERMRAISKDIPIVLMSGYAGATLAARALAVGAMDVLSKPLVSRDIARSLEGALSRRTPR
jgi:PAS domain S-box-containing protein